MDLSKLVISASELSGYIQHGKARRIVILKSETERMVFPVSPYKYSVTTEQGNKTFDILDSGEILTFGNVQLAKLKFGGFFPALKHGYPYVVNKIAPADAVALILKMKTDKAPARLIITESPVNMLVAIRRFNYNEKDGAGDVYFEIELDEYRVANIPQSNYQNETDGLTGLKPRLILI